MQPGPHTLEQLEDLAVELSHEWTDNHLLGTHESAGETLARHWGADSIVKTSRHFGRMLNGQAGMLVAVGAILGVIAFPAGLLVGALAAVGAYLIHRFEVKHFRLNPATSLLVTRMHDQLSTLVDSAESLISNPPPGVDPLDLRRQVVKVIDEFALTALGASPTDLDRGALDLQRDPRRRRFFLDGTALVVLRDLRATARGGA